MKEPEAEPLNKQKENEKSAWRWELPGGQAQEAAILLCSQG